MEKLDGVTMFYVIMGALYVSQLLMKLIDKLDEPYRKKEDKRKSKTHRQSQRLTVQDFEKAAFQNALPNHEPTLDELRLKLESLAE